jgi:hypothetical protein
MSKYVIFQTDKVTPLTTIEAENVEINGNFPHIEFTDRLGDTIAIFNWDNISGFKKLEDKENE